MVKKYILLLLCFGSLHAGAQTTMATRVVKDSLFIPWEIIYGPDNNIWFTQKNGYICRLNPGSGRLDTLYHESNAVIRGEGGMLGLALHPDFPATPYLYAAYNYVNGSNYEERIVRYTYNGSTSLGSPMTLKDRIGANTIHNGCRLLISGDKLFFSAGDAANQSSAQNANSVNGKIHRINLDGTIPADNPVSGSSMWSLGHRNPQGMVMVNGRLYISEHGNTSDDEINIIEKGRNYGWPTVEGWCNTTAERSFCNTNNVKEPAIAWTPTLAVCGLDYYNAPLFPELRGKLIMATLKDSKLYALTLNAGGDSVSRVDTLLKTFGRLRDVCITPGGRIYVSTSKSNAAGTGTFIDQIVEIYNPNATSVAGQEPALGLELYPNPAGNTIELRYSGKRGAYRIAGMDGRTLRQGVVSGAQQRIGLEALPAGVYMLQVQEDGSGRSAVQRFVRQ
jgi:glucose/arabinose dehydrogenase